MDRKRKANGEACTHAANAAMFEELRRQYNAPFNTKKKNL
jgi:hypothetical protein